MLGSLVVIAFVLFQDVIPFKPAEEFDVKLDYNFRPRPLSDHNTVNVNDNALGSSGVLPYLKLHITLIKLPVDKGRVAISDNKSTRPSYRRVSSGSVLELDLGFTADMIDRVNPHEYTITFVDAERQPLNRIVIRVDEDGSFFVNGEKRGRF